MANKYCNANHSFSYRSILSKRFPFIINGILMVAHVRHRPPQATDDAQHRVVSYISSLREQVCTRDIVIIVGYSMLVILPLCWCLITIYLERVQNQNDKKKKISRLTVAVQLKFSGRFYKLTRTITQTQKLIQFFVNLFLCCKTDFILHIMIHLWFFLCYSVWQNN